MGSKKSRKKLATKNDELKKTVSGLKGQLTKAEKKLAKAQQRVERWKKEAATHRKAANRSNADLKKLRKNVEQAADPTPSSSATSATVPDETWTVAQLRAEARSRGLTGMSNKPKAQLLAALT